MAARTDQLDEISTAAQWLEERQAEVLPLGFNLQAVEVNLAPDDNGIAPRVDFRWQPAATPQNPHAGNYTFTVS